MKKILIISLIFNLGLIGGLVFYFKYSSTFGQSFIQENRQKRFERKLSQFKILADTPQEIIFLGADLIEEGHWSELLQNPKIKNRGIRGDRAEDILERLDEVTQSKPDKIFLLSGYQDLKEDKAVSDIVATLERILEKIQEDSPKSRIYIQSTPPLLYQSKNGGLSNEEIIVYNGKLKDLAKKYKLQYIDLFNSMIGNNKTKEIRSDYTNDGYHLNAGGYARWKALIERYVSD